MGGVAMKAPSMNCPEDRSDCFHTKQAFLDFIWTVPRVLGLSHWQGKRRVLHHEGDKAKG